MAGSRQGEVPRGMFGVLACEVRTGVVVDAFGGRTPEPRAKFLCFDSHADAMLHCRARVRVDPETECWIYDETGKVVGEFRHAGALPSDAPTHRSTWWSRLRLRGTRDGYCCDVARGLFVSRASCGEFLVAGCVRDREVRFLAGSAMAHREDYAALLPTLRAVERAFGDFGISNYKLLTYGDVRFCASCGANLRRFYGRGGGELRDDAFVDALRSTIR